jgi:glycosyltransferase involved in cell wall biosynthesis
MEKITFCMPVKSNLRYLKASIASIRENASRKDHDIIIYVDEDTDGTCTWLDSLKDPNIQYFKNTSCWLLGIGKGYDFCIDKIKTDVFMIFHADMMLGKNADEEAFKHLKPQTVVCCTRIEPPLHPPGPEKIVIDFGLWPEENIGRGFQKKDFNAYVEQQLSSQDTKVTNGCFAPWMMYKKDFDAVGGHDRIFHSYHEDSDLFNRFLLKGYKMIQPWTALVYHLTCRAGIFENGLDKKSARVISMQHKSFYDFVRKWGTIILHDAHLMPIVKNKYDIGFVIRNAFNYDLVKELEPWCDTLYLDHIDNIYTLIKEAQFHTSFDMKKRVRPIAQEKTNKILVHFNLENVETQQVNFLMQLPAILEDSGEIGEMTHDIFTLNIGSLETFNDKLINATDPWHTNRLLCQNSNK